LIDKVFKKGDRIVIWGENRTGWVAVFWSCIARGIQVVPVDYRSSPELVGRIHREVHARLLVAGDLVEASAFDVAQVLLAEMKHCLFTTIFSLSEISPDDVVEIVYTSGTTGEPMGVVHRHKNICANLNPIQREMHKYEKFARPFQPVRILDMLPLSHLFGQSLGLFTPPLLGGAVVFMTEFHAGAILETIRRERVSVLVSVPKLLLNLQHEIERRFHPRDVQARRKGIPALSSAGGATEKFTPRLGLSSGR